MMNYFYFVAKTFRSAFGNFKLSTACPVRCLPLWNCSFQWGRSLSNGVNILSWRCEMKRVLVSLVIGVALCVVGVSAVHAANTNSLALVAASSQYAYAADSTSLSVTGDLTLELWVKFETLADNSTYSLVGKYGSEGNQKAYWFQIDKTSGVVTLNLIYSDNGASGDAKTSSAITVTTGVWYHFAVTLDVSVHTAIFYQNGTAVGTASGGTRTSIYDANAPLMIGAVGTVASPSLYLDGVVDEVRVWNDIRTQQEITFNYQKELTPANEPNLVGYWRLNNDYNDSTSNHNDLTPSGSPSFSATVPNWTNRVVTFYSGAGGSGSLEVDNTTWSTTHGATSAQFTTYGRTGCSGNGGTYYLGREFFPFDTSALTSDATISSAVFSLYAGDSHAVSETWVLVQSTQTSNTSLVNADYPKLGTTSGGTIAATSVVIGQYNNITLNATGLTWISKIGYTPLALRGLLDMNNSAPGNVREDIYPDFTTNKPKLVITYTTNQPPTAFSLLTPPDYTSTNSNKPTFSWGTSTDPEEETITYTLKLSTNVGFDPVYKTFSSITTTSYTPGPGDEIADGSYYWKVIASDGEMETASTEAWQLTVDTQKPVAPTIS